MSISRARSAALSPLLVVAVCAACAACGDDVGTRPAPPDTTTTSDDGDTTGDDSTTGDSDTTGDDSTTGDDDTTTGDDDTTTGDGDGDGEPTLAFDGVDAIEVLEPGTVRLSWSAAAPVEPGAAIEYDVYGATVAGGQDFSTADVTTAALTIDIGDLAVEKGLRHYFVVRAREVASGATDDNEVEASALFVAKDEIEFIADYPLGSVNGGIVSDIAVNDDLTLAAVGGFGSGNSYLFDISDPTAPMLVDTIEDFGTQNDVEFYGDLLYVSHERRDDRVGMTIYDVSDRQNAVKVRDLVADGDPIGVGASFCHNITFHEGAELMYCSSTFGGVDGRGPTEVQIFSIGFGDLGGTPENPVYLGSIGDPNGGIHDVFGRDDRIYASFLWGGVSVIDVTDPTSPMRIGEYEYSGQFAHNAWPSKDGNYLFLTDERSQRSTDGMRVLDIRDLDNIEQVAKFERGPESSVIHNVEVEGNYAYISYYTEGVYIVDVSDPANPVEVDQYDTYEGSNTGTYGCWGIQATKGPLVFASDMERGLVILEWDRPETRITGR